MKNTSARVLLYDIETAPNVAYVWGKYQQDVIDYEREWELLTFAYKWLGEKKVTSVTRLDFKDRTDKSIVCALWEVLDSADVVISHNGIQFDNKKANAKFAQHWLTPVKPAQQIDTKRVAKTNFNFNSNKLDDLARILGVGRKVKHSGFDMWLGCMAGKRESFEEMAFYNRGDVDLLERVYMRLRPWINNHPNLSQLEGRPNGCPTCGSTRLKSKGKRYTKKSVYRQYRCLDCTRYVAGAALKDVAKPKYSGF